MGKIMGNLLDHFVETQVLWRPSISRGVKSKKDREKKHLMTLATNHPHLRKALGKENALSYLWPYYDT